MSSTVFVDTSAFYALTSETDDEHATARTIREQLKRDTTPLLTTNYVLLESVSLLQRRHGMSAAKRFGDFVREEVQVVWVTEPQHQAAWDYWKQRDIRGLSLVDCSCIAVMRERGIQRIFGFDDQFRTAGFRLLDAPPSVDRAAEPLGASRARSPRRRSARRAT